MNHESSLATLPAPNADTRLSLSRGPIPTTVGLAHRLDWLAHELRHDAVELVTLRSDEEAPVRAGRPGRALPGLREGTNVAALWDRARGADTRLLGLTWIDEYQGVLAAPDGGIAEPAQLAGRRLALPLRDGEQVDVARAAARRGFHAATGLAGVFCDEVAYVDLPAGTDAADPYAAEVAALLAGEVDAIYVAGPAGIAVSGRIGAREVVDLGAHLDPMVRAGTSSPAPLTVDARLLRAQPELLVRVLATLLRAGAWAELAPREVVALVAAETGATPHDVTAAYGAGLHQHFHLDLSAHKLAALTAQKDFLLTHGFLDDDVEIAAWIDPGPLAAARELIAVR